jgi:hypothetical protein
VTVQVLRNLPTMRMVSFFETNENTNAHVFGLAELKRGYQNMDSVTHSLTTTATTFEKQSEQT